MKISIAPSEKTIEMATWRKRLRRSLSLYAMLVAVITDTIPWREFHNASSVAAMARRCA